MPYMFYIDGLELPVTPSKLETKIKNNNRTVNLINDGDVNILKNPGLTDISFDALLPQSNYPFSKSNKATEYLDKLEQLKSSKSSFQFIVYRTSSTGKNLFDTNMTVSLEEYTIKEDANNNTDIIVSIKLKQYRPYATKTLNVSGNSVSVTNNRTISSGSGAKSQKQYTVQSGDTLWNIAKKQLGNGSDYTKIYELNKDKIQSPNSLNAGIVLIMP